MTSQATLEVYDAAVVGAGPGGLTAIANLLDMGLSNLVWIDPCFAAGRLGEAYREVPRYVTNPNL